MTTVAQARNKALDVLESMSERLGVDLVLDEQATRAESWCWVFFYNSRAYIETGAFSHALAGNGPIVVERATGRLHELITARPIDEQLEELRRAVEANGS